MPKKSLTYEKAIQELQQIIDRLQNQTIGVDELAEQMAKATELIALCKEKLRMAKQQTEKLFEVSESEE